jgi:hypothetical protein
MSWRPERKDVSSSYRDFSLSVGVEKEWRVSRTEEPTDENNQKKVVPYDFRVSAGMTTRSWTQRT